MKFAVKVLPKPEVLDTQGSAVRSAMQSHGFDLSACNVGRYIVLEVNATDAEQGKKMVTQMTEKGLYNPLIENYQLEQL